MRKSLMAGLCALTVLAASTSMAQTTISTNIFQNNGRLGVGRNDPQVPADIVGSIRTTNFFYFGSGTGFSGMFFIRGGTGGFEESARIGQLNNANYMMTLGAMNNRDVRVVNDEMWGILVRDNNRVGIGTATPTTTLDVNGTIRASGDVSAAVVEIRGQGNDLAESFKVNGAPDSIAPGMVVAIDATRTGELQLANEPYDRKVAGIISGAGDLYAGIHLGGDANPEEGFHPVALSGRVWCWVDADLGAVQPGDSLTTSPTLGHAMVVSDHARATGATIGKAMTGLDGGKGLVLVLVNLR